ncbi:PKD domain containing protein [Arenibacter sp. F26102]|uniref:PKD domain-containing protein n=1 Tax=Arenibacter sp. F26102 TaxID=2926416 RepID=UPI001FF4F9F6|nr:PKD domain containing protein [Arenibacter sp. F26102]MCK0146506.1 PKD domain containing protein [Arenibacter sp. F26102]
MKNKKKINFQDHSLAWSISLCLLIGNILIVEGQSLPTYNTARNGEIFQIFQFPRNQMPRIDGDKRDWELVPENYTYGTDLLNDTEDGMGTDIDPKDLDVKVTIGWVKDLNRIYFLYEAYDDFWDFERFNPEGYMNDIFELVVDGDLSGGPFIQNPVYDREQMKWEPQTSTYIENHFNFSGVHAQNYHIYTPPVNNAWALVWGSQSWISEFPHANYAYDYDFKHGESGTLVLEGWITPYDYAHNEGPQRAVESELKENKVIGLSWSILDFDGGKREGHVNLAHNVKMVSNASYLCAFQLMPLEKEFLDSIKAAWTFKVIDEEMGIVAFKDESIGEIEKWKWDFGNGDSSTEQNPIYRFKEKNVRTVITLEVEGANGSSKRTRYWEVMIR